MVQVIYRSRTDRPFKVVDRLSEPVLELSWNNWDDYGHKTTLKAVFHSDTVSRPLDSLKILIKGQDFTAKYFEALVTQGWDGTFPPPDTDYVSNPTQIGFYEEIIAIAGIGDAYGIASVLRDASLLVRVQDDSKALSLVAEGPFNTSLLRERGDQQAFSQGWKLFSAQSFSVESLRFRFEDPSGDVQTLHLAYSAGSPFPHDVNVLIGPNGAGKSQMLRQLVDHWLQVEGLSERTGFEETPNLNRLIAISYSPFERLRVDTQGLKLADSDVYRYFGLRGRSADRPTAAPSLSLDHARRAAVASLIACAADDQRFSAISAWSRKLSTLHSVLREAIDFDFAAVEVPSSTSGSSFQLIPISYDDPTLEAPGTTGDSRRYVRIDAQTGSNLNVDALLKHAIRDGGVTLFKDKRPLEMSSGQRLFTYIVINLLGSIRRNSLVLIDEPELFLHPTLEIALISMLKTILDAYACKALIATHSLVLVREVPRDCVHVFVPTSEGLFIKHPPFQTFGGDVQRISSYVFGDKAVSKPFEKWLVEQIKLGGSREDLLARLGPENLNEELIIELSAASAGRE